MKILYINCAPFSVVIKSWMLTWAVKCDMNVALGTTLLQAACWDYYANITSLTVSAYWCFTDTELSILASYWCLLARRNKIQSTPGANGNMLVFTQRYNRCHQCYYSSSSGEHKCMHDILYQSIELLPRKFLKAEKYKPHGGTRRKIRWWPKSSASSWLSVSLRFSLLLK